MPPIRRKPNKRTLEERLAKLESMAAQKETPICDRTRSQSPSPSSSSSSAPENTIAAEAIERAVRFMADWCGAKNATLADKQYVHTAEYLTVYYMAQADREDFARKIAASDLALADDVEGFVKRVHDGRKSIRGSMQLRKKLPSVLRKFQPSLFDVLQKKHFFKLLEELKDTSGPERARIAKDLIACTAQASEIANKRHLPEAVAELHKLVEDTSAA